MSTLEPALDHASEGNRNMNLQNFESSLRRIRSNTPLIHCITNHVVMNWTANCLLAMGASPVMTHDLEDIPEIINHSRALLVNIGTLDSSLLKSMSFAMGHTKRKNITIVLDPVGAGATQYRTKEALALIQTHTPTVIRGNASEILALAGFNVQTRGVDSVNSSAEAVEAAKKLAKQYQCVVSVSGAVDYTVSEDSVLECKHGHPIMTRVVGMGCAAGALIAAFCSVGASPLQATHEAMCLIGQVGECAQRESAGSGSFQVKFLDSLYSIG